jgi:hypothetical protein
MEDQEKMPPLPLKSEKVAPPLRRLSEREAEEVDRVINEVLGRVANIGYKHLGPELRKALSLPL